MWLLSPELSLTAPNNSSSGFNSTDNFLYASFSICFSVERLTLPSLCFVSFLLLQCLNFIRLRVFHWNPQLAFFPSLIFNHLWLCFKMWLNLFETILESTELESMLVVQYTHFLPNEAIVARNLSTWTKMVSLICWFLNRWFRSFQSTWS
jgi:hypothetical protein